MQNSTEKDIIVELLSLLSDNADQQRSTDHGEVAAKRQKLQTKYPPVTRAQIKGIFSKSDILDLRKKAFVYCPTVLDAGQPVLPVLTLNAGFNDGSGNWISIYLVCWVLCDGKWHVVPIRFERPQADHMSGAHGYNHAQFFWSLLDNGDPLEDGSDMIWLPFKQPAIPLLLDPHTPAILASAIISLYGARGASPYMSALQGTSLSFFQRHVSPALTKASHPSGSARSRRRQR